jgi:hypothetical protein
MISRYRKRISIPTLRRAMDRIDARAARVHRQVPRVDCDKLTGDRLGEPSERALSTRGVRTGRGCARYPAHPL